ncbi:MAG: protein kinase [Deltaproteobacteria bacterium]|nr:protein kinase [Deltaproteobacteria bacterium]
MTAVDLEFDGGARFEIHRRLGSGGMGVVYEASDRVQDTRVALKTLRGLDEYALLRLKNEFRSLRDLSHPNLVKLGELIHEAGHWFMTMELVEGEDFLAHARRRGEGEGTDEARLRMVLVDLAQGVQALHLASKVHRDIKPSNVLVTREGRAVLLDFGLVADTAAAGESESSSSQVVGTAEYMAPEQAASKPVGPAADWYSVGVMLYQALTGRLPFSGTPLEIMMNKHRYEPPPPRALVPSAPVDLDALCVDLLRYDPADRPSGEVILERLGVKTAADGGRPQPAPTQVAVFVGRKRELEVLKGASEASRGGKAVSVFVHGESGLGKTALVRQFIEGLAAERRAVVLSGRCYERESVPYKAFDGVMERLSKHLSRMDQVDAAFALPRDAAQLARVFPVMRRVPAMVKVAQAAPHVTSPQELRARAFGALRELLSRMADREQVVLFVDDFQWADADSLALLCELLRPPGAPGLLFLATVRGSDGAEMATAVAAVAGGIGDVRHVVLSNLTEEESRTLASELVAGSGVDVEGIAREASGHPMFIHELARHVSQRAGQDAPVRLDEALWERVQELEAQARRLLEVIAVAGSPIRLATVASAAGLRVRETDRLVAVLRAANLVRSARSRGADSVETYHDRVRETVLARLADEQRRAHHGRLASALEAEGTTDQDPQVVVRHLEAAGSPEQAAKQAQRAAGVSSEKLAFDQAADLYRTALRLWAGSDEEKRRIQALLGDALVNAGRGPEAADAYLAAAEGADALTRLECWHLAASQLLTSGHIERGLNAMTAILADIGVKPPGTPLRSLMSLIWQRAKLRVRGIGWRERDPSDISARTLTQIDIFLSVATGFSHVDPILGTAFQTRGLLLALRAGERRRVARALYHQAILGASQGPRGVKRGWKLLDAARPVTMATRDPYLLGWDTSCRGVVHYVAGDFHAALDELRAGENMFREQKGTAWELGSVRLFLLHSLRHLGRLKELRRDFDEYVRDAGRRGDRYTETTITRCHNVVWLAQDAPSDARRDLGVKTWAPPEQGYHMQHWYELRAHAELDLYEGEAHRTLEQRHDGFLALGRSMLLRVQIIRAESIWLRGRLALAKAEKATAGDVRGAALLEAERAARMLAKEHVGYADAWAWLLQAGIAAQSGNKDRLVACLKQAIALAEASFMDLCAAVARRRLGTAVGGAEGRSLIEQADTLMASEEIRSPERMIEVIAPGFAEARG